MTLSPEDLKYLEPEFQKLAELERETSNWNPSRIPIPVYSELTEKLAQECDEHLSALLTALITSRKRVEELEEAYLALKAVDRFKVVADRGWPAQYTCESERKYDQACDRLKKAEQALTKTKGRVD